MIPTAITDTFTRIGMDGTPEITHVWNTHLGAWIALSVARPATVDTMEELHRDSVGGVMVTVDYISVQFPVAELVAD